MTIIWKRNMSVGSKVIDDEHKYLFSLVNCVLLAIKVGDPEEIKIFIEQLIAYTEEHFSHEEKLQINIAYPGYAENKKQHQIILKQLQSLEGKLLHFINLSPPKNHSEEDEKQAITNTPEQLIKEISGLLRHWILDHVLTVDRKMQHYLSNLPQNKRSF